MKQELQHICDFFDLGKIQRFKKAGGSNENFFVSTEKGEYLVKILTNQHGSEALRQEQQFLQRLTDNDFKFIPYLYKDGDSIFNGKDYLALVQEKLNAVAPNSLTPSMIAQLGVELAKLHLIPHQGLPDKKSWLQRGDLKNGIKIIKEKYLEINRIKNLVTISEQSNVDWSKFPQAIIHADLFMENTLFRGGEFVAIIDWEEVTVNAAVLDFAMSVVGCCFPNNQFDLDLYSAFYTAYNRVRSFGAAEVGVLTQAVRFAGLTCAIWKFLHSNHFKPERELNQEYEMFWKQGLDIWAAPLPKV